MTASLNTTPTPTIIYPLNLNNIRKSLINAYGFISTGAGNGLNVLPVIDNNLGNIVNTIIGKSSH
jgi:hypothetical protein